MWAPWCKRPQECGQKHVIIYVWKKYIKMGRMHHNRAEIFTSVKVDMDCTLSKFGLHLSFSSVFIEDSSSKAELFRWAAILAISENKNETIHDSTGSNPCLSDSSWARLPTELRRHTLGALVFRVEESVQNLWRQFITQTLDFTGSLNVGCLLSTKWTTDI